MTRVVSSAVKSIAIAGRDKITDVSDEPMTIQVNA